MLIQRLFIPMAFEPGIWYGTKSPLLVSHHATHYTSFILKCGEVLQQGNAHLDVAHICKNYLEENNIDVFPWPAIFPVLNPIGILWDLFQWLFHWHLNPAQIQQEIQQFHGTLTDEWTAIPENKIRCNCLSMKHFCYYWHKWRTLTHADIIAFSLWLSFLIE